MNRDVQRYESKHIGSGWEHLRVMTLTDLSPKLRTLATAIDRGDLTNPGTAAKRLREWADALDPPKTVRPAPEERAGRG